MATFKNKKICTSGPIFDFCSNTRHNIGSRTLVSHVSSYPLNILDEINEIFIVSGKYVDNTEPIPTNTNTIMICGVAVFWKKELSSFSQQLGNC